MRIAKEGYPLILAAAAVGAAAFVMGWLIAGGLLTAVTLAVGGFFRDPDRRIPEGNGLVVSPADGRVVSIAPVRNSEVMPEAKTRISIFLSPLDVHINRMPVAAVVEDVVYQPGKFLAAYKADATAANERNAIHMRDGDNRRLAVAQIAGVLARRIVCRVKRGDKVARGERFGLIMFGSRTDTYLPPDCRIEVVEGQRVKGGETILGRFI